MINAILHLLIFSACIGIDRLTKIWAISVCDQQWALNQYAACDVVINRGISWSMFDGDSSLVFLLVSLAIVIIILLFAAYIYHRIRNGWGVLPHVVVLAGAISNMIDRVQYNGVVDFIALQFQGYHFPIFNVADICIVLGIFALIIYEK